MKTRALLMAMVCTMVAALTACDSDDDNNEHLTGPTATFTEVGRDNSHEVAAGGELHVEADIEAEGLIERITVRIKTGADEETLVEETWETGKYVGVRNTEFHEHIDIAPETPLGECVLTLSVWDAQGTGCVVGTTFNVVETETTTSDEE